MPRIFDITTAKDKLDLDDEGKCQATFSVSNSTGATTRGRARVIPGDPVQERWYKIEGDHERTLRERQTTQYIVRVAPPRDAPRGEYSVRLDMVALDNTDEVAVEGPRVVVLCKGLAAPAPAKGFPKWLVFVIAAVVLLAGGGLAAFLLTRDSSAATAPKVVGLLFDDAKSKIEAAGLVAKRGDAVPGADVAAGTVVVQKPAADAPVTKGEVVVLSVAGAPSVVGLLFDDAKSKIEAAGLVVKRGDTIPGADVAAGTVLEQKPLADAPVAKGDTVVLSVAGVEPEPASDILWYNSSTGETQIWLMNGYRVAGRATVLAENGSAALAGPPWSIVGINDMNGDGKPDVVWHNSANNETKSWLMDGHKIVGMATVLAENGSALLIGLPWSIVGINDMNGDGKSDIVWHNSSTTETQIWLMDGHRVVGRPTVLAESGSAALAGPPWSIVGINDMNGDGKPDVVWHNSSNNETKSWLMDGHKIVGMATVLEENGSAALAGPPWSIVGTGVFNPLAADRAARRRAAERAITGR